MFHSLLINVQFTPSICSIRMWIRVSAHLISGGNVPGFPKGFFGARIVFREKWISIIINICTHPRLGLFCVLNAEALIDTRFLVVRPYIYCLTSRLTRGLFPWLLSFIRITHHKEKAIISDFIRCHCSLGVVHLNWRYTTRTSVLHSYLERERELT